MNIQTIAESHSLLDQHAAEQEKLSPVLAALLVFNPALVTWMAKQTMSESAFTEYLAAANIAPQIADAECLTIDQHLLTLKDNQP
jgi:hypothetical protein